MREQPRYRPRRSVVVVLKSRTAEPSNECRRHAGRGPVHERGISASRLRGFEDFPDKILDLQVPLQAYILFTAQSRLLTTPRKEAFENIMGKNVFCPFRNKFQFLSYIYFVVCKSFQFELV